MKSHRDQLPLFILVPVLNEIGPEEDPGVLTIELHGCVVLFKSWF